MHTYIMERLTKQHLTINDYKNALLIYTKERVINKLEGETNE